MRNMEQILQDLEHASEGDEHALIDLSTDEAKAIAASVAERLAELEAGERDSLLWFLQQVHDRLNCYEAHLMEGLRDCQQTVTSIDRGRNACLSYIQTLKLN